MGSAVGSVFSLAGLGLGFAGAMKGAEGTEARGRGEQAASEFRASKAEEAARFGRLQADLTDTVERESLATTIGNIDAVRAAAHTDPNSPTAAALEDRQTVLSERERLAKEGTLRAQADDDEASASYLRQAGAYAMMNASNAANAQRLAAWGKLFGGFGKMLGSGGGGFGGDGGGESGDAGAEAESAA